MTHLPFFCDLINALAHTRGAGLNPLTETGKTLQENLGDPDLLLFILIDGFGKTFLERLPRSSFLRDSYKRDLLSVFPSTTACAMTSLATGLPVSKHGIPGRYIYLKERNLHADTLAFRERGNKKLLSPQTSLSSLWPFPSLIPHMENKTFSLIPEVLRNSPFERFLCGGTETEGYRDIKSAAEIIAGRVKARGKKDYIFFYLWELDSLCHKIGTDQEEVEHLLIEIDKTLETLSKTLRGKGRMVITADHGHITVKETDKKYLTSFDPLAKILMTPPFGEPRAPQFIVKPERRDEFMTLFYESFGGSFHLYSAAEAEEAGIFGPSPFSDFAKGRFGDFIAVAKDTSLLLYGDSVFAPSSHKGEHGGNLPEERIIPLLIS